MSLVEQPERPPGSPEAVPFASVAETHTGAVFFFGSHAFKVKKPLTFDFLDFASRQTRREACHREIELNRRLAPDVYLGVADVVGPAGELWDHLVVMRRLPAERKLSTLVTDGVDVGPHLDRLARLLTNFHARADRSPLIDSAASAEEVRGRWERNSAQLAALAHPPFRHDMADRMSDLAARYAAGRARLFEYRILEGAVCDGHGDLLADDIFCLDDGPRVLDCLEFDDRLRYGDILEDVAFLAMDLERLNHPELAAAFLERYTRYSGATWPSSLEHYYVAYRAQVRCLVAAIRHQQGDPDSETTANSLMTLCVSHLERGQVRLVVVGGLPGSGKSSLASRLATAIDAVVLRSDEIRKQSAGLDVAAPGGRDLYVPARSHATYATMLGEAETCLQMGHSVVLDATFVEPDWRKEARALSERTTVVLSELHCFAPTGLLEKRVSERAARGERVSDASVDVVRALADHEPIWPNAQQIDTSGSPDDTFARAFQVVVDES